MVYFLKTVHIRFQNTYLWQRNFTLCKHNTTSGHFSQGQSLQYTFATIALADLTMTHTGHYSEHCYSVFIADDALFHFKF